MIISKLFFLFLCLLFSTTFMKASTEDYEIYKTYLKEARQNTYTNLSKAISQTESARLIAMNLKDNNLIFDADLLMGSLYALKGNYDSAMEYYAEAESCLNPDDPDLVAKYNMHMGAVYWSLKEYRKSLYFATRSMEYYQEIKDTLNLAVLLNLKGLIEIDLGNYAEATLSLDSALYLNRKINNKSGILDNLNNIAIIPGDEDKKIGYLQEVIRNNEKDSLTWSLAENYNNMASCFLHKGDISSAKQYLTKANGLAEKINSSRLLIDNLSLASEIAYTEKNYQKAYLLLQEKEVLLHDMAVKNKLEKIEEELIVKRKRIQENLLNNQKLILLQQESRTRLILTFGIIIFILILLFIYIYHRKKIDVYRLKEEINLKNQQIIEKELFSKKNVIASQIEQITMHNNELINLIYYIKSKDKLIQNILLMLKENIKSKPTDIQSQLKITSSFIKQHMDKDKQINLFTQHINDIEIRFYKLLDKKHPGLTKNEKILASYLRIGLSTKEISFLLDSNPKTINMARYRLRKSLNLESDDNLSDYLVSLLNRTIPENLMTIVNN